MIKIWVAIGVLLIWDFILFVKEIKDDFYDD